ncbi:MAG: DEAD/DEAH box helicase [Gloeomargarita sp. SKYBB_i_bin120]|nr:DEAD/DEAH box helicase [Gloeomargarita sp. SKYB120]MDW8177472.1 DEAD/DEAH box helicase [Gloeomargarita sp. SKYBB_i_bin120]
MNHYLDPVAVIRQLREDLIRYLLTAYPLRDDNLRQQFKEELEKPGNIWQVPYLEGTQPYRPSLTLRQLTEQGVLHPDILQFFDPDRPLYQHQVEAIRAVVTNQENVIVATGTGSGKTECFLIPIIDTMLREGSRLQQAGVRVLILYPMNALVNDQIKRLRSLLCHQCETSYLIKFSFYTSRTCKKPKDADSQLRDELAAYSDEELLRLIPCDERDHAKQLISDGHREEVVKQAVQTVRRVQVLSREEIQSSPPHILVTNYSMLEYMLIRPREREAIFERSRGYFHLLVLDEAHTYNGSVGTEVSMLLKRLKHTVGIDTAGQLRCIATSATLGDRSADTQIQQFAQDLFGEAFKQVIRGERVSPVERLGQPYNLPEHVLAEEIYEYFYALNLPDLQADLTEWERELSYIVPPDQLESAKRKVEHLPYPQKIHSFLWYALKQHPLFHRVIELLAAGPKPWEEVTQSPLLWSVHTGLDGAITEQEKQKLEQALAHLLQLGTLARESPESLPLLPVRLHLLFRSMEGAYVCVNPKCPGTEGLPNQRYGKLYLSQKKICDYCKSPVLELASCRKCGQAYTLMRLDSQGRLLPLPSSLEALEVDPSVYVLSTGLDSMTLDEEEEETELSPTGWCLLHQRDGWLGEVGRSSNPSCDISGNHYRLTWHVPPGTKNTQGGYLSKCPACSANRRQTSVISRFVSYTDAPLEVMIDSLFTLLPESARPTHQPTRRKLLVFSDVRQDAAFFASDFQRTHTEVLYRQCVWQAFQQSRDPQGVASVGQVENALIQYFLTASIPHPDRSPEWHHQSYVPHDPLDSSAKNRKDCEDRARRRARELLLREFGLPASRRFSIESLGLLTCHLDWHDVHYQAWIDEICKDFQVSPSEAVVFLTALTDLIRLYGLVSIERPSDYFPEVGGIEGEQPSLLDSHGRIKKFLKLQKAIKDDRNAISFCAYFAANNRLVTSAFANYFEKVFGWDAQSEYEQLKKVQIKFYEWMDQYGIFTKYGHGYQLTWNLLNIYETKSDWCRCNTCRQIMHLPYFSQVDNVSSSFNIRKCPIFKCTGVLEPITLETINDDYNHYRYLICSREILPLRAQEHTAQLETDDLAQRESRFRRGSVNLLSCSTTLEMGVDIGELQAVVMRNFPPHVSNYQQRAGRAGRRTDGVAVSLVYGQRRPHDRYYFEQPELLIAGKNQIPKLDPTNSQIQERHIRTELLAAFLRKHDCSVESLTIANFFDLPSNVLSLSSSDDFNPSPQSLAVQFLHWLATTEAQETAKFWLSKLANQSNSEMSFLNQFVASMRCFEKQQLLDWSSLVDMRIYLENERRERPTERKRIDRRIDSVEAELKKVTERRLHDELARAGILPIYGFPIDVVRLMTGEKDPQGRTKHRLERDRRVALSEYAPGQDVIVDDRVYTSVGIVQPNKLEERYYWICQHCNYFTSGVKSETFETCSVCGGVPSVAIAKKSRPYRIPIAFTTEWGTEPKVTPYIKPKRQPTSQVFLAQEGHQTECLSGEHELFQLIYSRGGRFFLCNQGPSFRGYAICRLCGRDLTAQVEEQEDHQKKSKSKKSGPIQHTNPMTNRPCSGTYEWISLGHEFVSDLLKIRFKPETNTPRLFAVKHVTTGQEVLSLDASPQVNVDFWRSLTYALLAAAAQVIDVPRNELDGLFRPVSEGNITAEIIIYDNVPGGAGYSRKIGENFTQVLERAYEIVRSCRCSRSCYSCLRTYANQIFHDQLDRHQVEQFLQPLMEKIMPDPELQAFAPDAYRISHQKALQEFNAYSQHADGQSIIYLPELPHPEPFALHNLEQLIKAVYSRNQSVELIVSQLPQPTSPTARLLRKRLFQWLDQGVLQLYLLQDQERRPIELCLSSYVGAHRLALQGALDSETGEWLKTTTERGVNTVLQRLQHLKQQARPVMAAELEDKNTEVVFPDKTWKSMSITTLQQRLKWTQFLTPSPAKVIHYQDRYLQPEQAEILIGLLEQQLGPGTEKMILEMVQLWDENQEQNYKRRAEIQRVIQNYLQQKGLAVTLELKCYPPQQLKAIPHMRKLTLIDGEQRHHQVLFDKGLDFLVKDEQGTYSVTEPTYIVLLRG